MVDYGIKGEVALVLGGTGGLGFACAQALTAAGAQLLINGRDADRGREAVQALGSNATYLPGDVSQAADRTSVFDEVQRRGGVSILVTNAGGPPPARFLEAQPEAWTRAFETNVLAAVEAARAVLPRMIERRFGRIVNITSFVVKELYPNMALSNTVRVALTGAMASLAREAIQHGVTVNNILPGLMDTGALQRVIADRARRQNTGSEEVKMEMAASIPAGRLGSADDFGPLCAFLCSRQAGYITGQNVCVDGGLVRSLL
jgi:3-oxoacyl-[acyl-carrier protein] reductase